MSRVQHRVLVVDDQPSVLGVLHEALHTVGYEVEVAPTAAAGIAAAQARRPDVVLLDLRMPGGLSGDAAMPTFMRFAPVIIITGQDDPNLEKRLLGQGAFAYLRKPFSLDVLFKLVEAATMRPG